jgi:alpha/beta superfamily hydrolase
MNVNTVRQTIAGPAGAIECAIDLPAVDPRGTAILCHPHPQHGGTLDNKVVQTLARAFVQLGWRSVLVGASTLRQPMANVPGDTVVIHGETDDVVPLAATLAWARPQALPVIVFPGVGHFFHGQLGVLKNWVVQELQPRMPL